MTINRTLFALLFLATFQLHAQTINGPQKEALNKILYQHASDDGAGLAVGIVKEGKVIYERYLGFADLNYKVKNNELTRFNIASNGKQFTALCVLKLVEAGKLDLEDDFRKYLPDFYKNKKEKITIAHLISHTSGIRDVYFLWALQGKTSWQLFIDNGDALDLLKTQKDLNFKPGTAYAYSNSNYILLTEIIKQVSGQKFADFAKSIFLELSMPSTGFLTDYMEVMPNKARAYGNWGTWKEFPFVNETDGDGALFTTLHDQLQWEKIVQMNSGAYLSKAIINKSQERIAYDYGYGLEFGVRSGLDYTFHDGATGAYHATFLRFPNEKLSIVVAANSGAVPSNYLAWQIARLLLELEQEDNNKIYPDQPESVEDLDDIQDVLGIYRPKEGEGSVIKILEKDGALYRAIYQRDPVKLINEKGGLFEYETIKGLKMNFTNIGKPDQQFTLYMSSQQPSTYYKISELEMGMADKSELNGTFYNEETGAEFRIKYTQGNSYELTFNGRKIEAELISKDYLRMMDNYEFKVRRDQKGKVTGLSVTNTDRLQNVFFEKIE